MAEKKKSRVNEAGNYTKPALRRDCLTPSRQAAKVASRDSGLRVKRRCWLNATKRLAGDMGTNGSQEVTEVLEEVD